MVKKLLTYFKGYWVFTILSPILMILEVGADVIIPRFMGAIVNDGILQSDLGVVYRYGLWMVGAALFSMACGATSSFLGATAGQGFGANLRLALFDRIQRFSFANLDRFSDSTLIVRLTTDITTLSQVAQMSLRLAWRAPFMMIMAMVMALSINPGLSLIFAVALPILIVATIVIIRKAFPLFSLLQEKVDRLNSRVQENLTGIRVVKSFVREEHEKEKFEKVNDDLKTSALRALNIIIVAMPLMLLLMYGCVIAVLWLGGLKIQAGSMLPGDLISFITYIMQILLSVMLVAMYLINLTRARASAARVLEVLETEIDLVSPPAGRTELGSGRITFDQVSFRYPGNPEDTLHDINLEIPSGSTLGIIGQTGSAKTSLVQLIPRLYDVTAGAVRIDGTDVRDMDLPTLRDQVAFVLQKNTLFSGTIRENMQWGDAQASDAAIQAALETAQAWSFVSALPDGLDSWVEQGGLNFSGGQRQRLCIARALLKQPKVLILDDSTSAVDMATDARLRQSFRERLGQVTTLIIAQRVASIEHSHKILVLDEGAVSGFGTHDELLQTNEIYRDIYESQQGVIAE